MLVKDNGPQLEDYSADGDAWSALTFDDSRSRAYRWGEDGLAGVSDRKQFVNVTMAFMEWERSYS